MATPTDPLDTDTLAALKSENERLKQEKTALEENVSDLKNKAGKAAEAIGEHVKTASTGLTEVKDNLVKAAASGGGDKDPGPPWQWILVTGGLFAFAHWLHFNIADDLASTPVFQTTPEQLTLLGFTVALAAYLANARRDLVKSLATKTGSARRERRFEIVCVTSGEQMTVLLGLFVTARVIRLADASPSNDAYLIALMFTTIVYLACLHALEWILLLFKRTSSTSAT